MAAINFVPDDYIQQRQSSRANLLYLTLLAALLGGIGVTFSIIKMRQTVVRGELSRLDDRMAQAHEQIVRLEERNAKSKTMMKSMVMTAELLESAPRSVILACLTNNLPSGVSLLETRLQEKEIKVAPSANPQTEGDKKEAKPSQYQSAAAQNAKVPAVETRTVIETNLEIEGIAPSDIEVASYIANLSNSVLLDDVQLVQSREQQIEGITFRQFRLRTTLKSNLTLTKDDIMTIRKKREQTS
jgi:Tfp pilus assembly protein PilN